MGVARMAGGLTSAGSKPRGSKTPNVNPNSSPEFDSAEFPGDVSEQTELHADSIGGRKWSRLQTVVFVVLASAALWCAIGYGIFRLLSRS
jgi:hypothetical protein